MRESVCAPSQSGFEHCLVSVCFSGPVCFLVTKIVTSLCRPFASVKKYLSAWEMFFVLPLYFRRAISTSFSLSMFHHLNELRRAAACLYPGIFSYVNKRTCVTPENSDRFIQCVGATYAPLIVWHYPYLTAVTIININNII